MFRRHPCTMRVRIARGQFKKTACKRNGGRRLVLSEIGESGLGFNAPQRQSRIFDRFGLNFGVGIGALVAALETS